MTFISFSRNLQFHNIWRNILELISIIYSPNKLKGFLRELKLHVTS